LFAVGEEKIGAAGGAEVARENVLGAETEFEKLGAVGFAKVEEDVFGRRLVAGRGHVEPLDGIGLVAGAEFVEPGGGVGELREELSGDFDADFVAAASDGRAKGGEEVGGPGTEVHLHLANRFDGDAGQGAAPAGVDGGNGAFFGIDEEDRDTVGGLHGEEKAGTIGKRGVPRHGRQTFARFGVGGIDEVGDVGVELFEGDKRERAGAEYGLEAAAVFEDVFAGVPAGKAKVEDALAVKFRGAAGKGREAVNEPRKFREGRDFKNLQGVG